MKAVNKAMKSFLHGNPPPSKSSLGKSDWLDGWLKGLKAAFMRPLSHSKPASSLGHESPTVRGYTFDPLPRTVGGLYPY